MSIFFTILAACSSDPTTGTLPDNVGAAFAPCQESEIRFLSGKHNFQTVFEACGNNNFSTFSWSPDGKRIYFQLGQTGYVMNAEADNKATLTVPIPSPIGSAAWLTSSQLAIPVGPDAPESPNRVAIFDVEQKSVFMRNVPKAFIPTALRSDKPGEFLVVVADAEEGPQDLLRVDMNTGESAKAFEWLTAGFDTLTITPAADAVVVGRGDTVTHHTLSGDLEGTWTPATRGSVHPDGRWLALEHDGEEVSIFYQRAWDDMSEGQRRREAQRAERLASNLPESYPTTVRPPTLSFVDLTDDARFMLTSVYGSRFEWYEPSPYWASFIFWGFEGKQFRRNVLLGQMGNRFRATELGRDFMGVEPMNEIAKARSPSKKTDDPEQNQ